MRMKSLHSLNHSIMPIIFANDMGYWVTDWIFVVSARELHKIRSWLIFKFFIVYNSKVKILFKIFNNLKTFYKEFKDSNQHKMLLMVLNLWFSSMKWYFYTWQSKYISKLSLWYLHQFIHKMFFIYWHCRKTIVFYNMDFTSLLANIHLLVFVLFVY